MSRDTSLDVCLLGGTDRGTDWWLSITAPGFPFASDLVEFMPDDQQLVDLYEVIADFVASPIAPEANLCPGCCLAENGGRRRDR